MDKSIVVVRVNEGQVSIEELPANVAVVVYDYDSLHETTECEGYDGAMCTITVYDQLIHDEQILRHALEEANAPQEEQQ